MPFGINDGMLGSAIDDMTGQPAESKAEGGTRDTFDKNRWTEKQGSNLVDGEWIPLLTYTVEAQTRYNVGHGSAPVEETVGRWASAFYDSTAAAYVEGSVRVITDNANGTNQDTEISSIQTRRLDKVGQDKRAQEAVPEATDTDKVGEESVIQILFKRDPNSAGQAIDWTDANTQTAYDMTRYD